MIVYTYISYALIAAATYRLFRGPSMYDRLLALSMISALVVVLMCLYAVMYERSFYIDVAMIYSLLAFAEIVGYVKYYVPERASRSDA